MLDEVDAPLDDANVERFCTPAGRHCAGYRHAIPGGDAPPADDVAHGRLFGVTMQERGVSRLLSVDLQRAAAMVEPRLQAAE